MLDETGSPIAIDARREARRAGLTYVSTQTPGIARRRAGKGFSYQGPDLQRIADMEVVRRIRALAVPPAWRDVWICPRPDGHIQAVGYDALGRKQYRYHPRFRALREGAKFDHILTFAHALPRLRARVDADMRARGLGRDKVLATVVQLLETTMIRVGNRAYAEGNKSYGLTTLRGRHVAVEGGALKFHFKGKSGRTWRLGLRDRRIARIVRACQELPGQHLFQYLDDDGAPQSINSTDINDYLRRASGEDITAKDFRTWAGTVLAAEALAALAPPENLTEAKRSLNQVIQDVAARLGNTPTICRKCYVHPEVQKAYLAGEPLLCLDEPAAANDEGLHPEEVAVLAFLEARLTPGKQRRRP
ncbi:MAG TPA: DNA topoisomerase IB [Caulobacteraceae bacterium]|jgi:DNA topoisomerase-1|nr:DNA topoisomerase IB [Caulobacteraceae bacterium]